MALKQYVIFLKSLDLLESFSIMLPEKVNWTIHWNHQKNWILEASKSVIKTKARSNHFEEEYLLKEDDVLFWNLKEFAISEI